MKKIMYDRGGYEAEVYECEKCGCIFEIWNSDFHSAKFCPACGAEMEDKNE